MASRICPEPPEIAIATSPVVNTAMGEIADSIASAFGANQTQRVQNLMAIVNNLAMLRNSIKTPQRD